VPLAGSCEYLTSAQHDVIGGMLGFATYGGRGNTVPSRCHRLRATQFDSRHGLHYRLAWTRRKRRRIWHGSRRSTGHTLYYQSNYPRLQQVKARWDPRNLFRHALSIQTN